MSYLLARLNVGADTRFRAHCSTDDWDFRPLYTEGRCPICGWQAEGWPRPVPAWAAAFEHAQWDFIWLFGLAAVLLALAYLMAAVTGLLPH